MAAITQPRAWGPHTGRRYGSFAGKSAVPVVTTIDHIGLEWTLPPNLMHYTTPTNVMHWTEPDNLMHWTMRKEDNE